MDFNFSDAKTTQKVCLKSKIDADTKNHQK